MKATKKPIRLRGVAGRIMKRRLPRCKSLIWARQAPHMLYRAQAVVRGLLARRRPIVRACPRQRPSKVLRRARGAIAYGVWGGMWLSRQRQALRPFLVRSAGEGAVEE
jgi:hypothetical protein